MIKKVLIALTILAFAFTIRLSQRSDMSCPLTSYTVIEGDDLTSIANRFNINLMDLLSFNNLTDSNMTLTPGFLLNIPCTTNLDTMLNNTMNWTNDTTDMTSCPFKYTILAGDTLDMISTKLNVPMFVIVAYNTLLSTNLTEGDVLYIPCTVMDWCRQNWRGDMSMWSNYTLPWEGDLPNARSSWNDWDNDSDNDYDNDYEDW